MRFAKCTKQNVFKGCSQKPHGHLWNSKGTDHSLILQPHLTTKAIAKEETFHLLKVLGYDQIRHDELFKRLEAEINATDLD